MEYSRALVGQVRQVRNDSADSPSLSSRDGAQQNSTLPEQAELVSMTHSFGRRLEGSPRYLSATQPWLQLTALNIAEAPEEINVPGWRYHTLSGDLSGFYCVTVNGNWPLIFMFNGKDAELVDYKDYH